MELFDAIKGRTSCRNFSQDPVDEHDIMKILESAIWAPSPMNAQPWEFLVIENPQIKEKIFQEAEQRRKWGQDVSGWKWLGKYSVDFLKIAPILIVVVGDPQKTGLDAFMEEGGVGYQHACAAAIQNMHLSAHALGLGTLWFTLFDRKEIRKILDIPQEKVPLAIICVGKPKENIPPPPRKNITEKVSFIR